MGYSRSHRLQVDTHAVPHRKPAMNAAHAVMMMATINSPRSEVRYTVVCGARPVKGRGFFGSEPWQAESVGQAGGAPKAVPGRGRHDATGSADAEWVILAALHGGFPLGADGRERNL